MAISSIAGNSLANLFVDKNEKEPSKVVDILDTANDTAKIETSKGKSSASKTSDAFEELERYMKMSPFEIFRENWLKKHNMTEEDLAAMPPEKQKAFEEAIKEEFKKMAKESAGMQNNLATSLLI